MPKTPPLHERICPRCRAPFADVVPRLLTLKRAAAESGLSYFSLRDAHFRGDLAVVRIGRAWYVEIAEFSRFVERSTVRHGSNDAA